MTGPSILDRLNARLLPTGRRLFALYAMLKVALGLKLTALGEEIEAAIAHDKECLGKEKRWSLRKSNPSKARGEALVLDSRGDKLLADINRIVDGFDSGDATDPQAVSAARLRDVVFPEGLGALTSQTFEEQLASMDRILELMRTDNLEDVKALGLQRKASDLEKIVDQFRAELEKTNEHIAFDEVRAARNEGQILLGNVLVEILATHKARDPETVRRRGLLLAEYDRQSNAVYESQRRRKPVLDVDPDTGAEIAPPDGPLDEEADAA